MSNTFLQMATNDQHLIKLMKETIEYQGTSLKKRNHLV
jgi:hypothetical protein